MRLQATVTEPEPVAAFCERLHPRLVGALRLHCGDDQAAQELAQEALARAWERWRSVQAMASPEAWVFRVALNLSTSRGRRLAAERRAHERLDVPRPAAADEADRLAVRAAVAALPDRQRAALVLRYYADLPVAEVAVAMRCAEGTVKSLTAKAVANLRAAIDDDVEVVEHA